MIEHLADLQETYNRDRIYKCEEHSDTKST